MSKDSMKYRLQKGFTLIELMVVVAIIAILMAAGLVAFTNAQQSSRNARRRADINAISKAAEQYYGNSGGVYPTAAANLNSSVYFPSGSMPLDPKSPTQDYNLTFPAVNGSPGYCICAQLEFATGQGGKGNATNNTCTYGSGTNANYFCMSPLQ